MNRLPVYQMNLVPDGAGELGLIFSVNTEDILPPVSIPLNYHDKPVLGDRYYLPGELYGEYIEFELNFVNDQDTKNAFRLPPIGRIQHSDLAYPIRFQIFNSPLRSVSDFYRSRYLEFEVFEYIGSPYFAIPSFTQFALLEPMDLLLMDELYIKSKTCFVGLTPMFGRQRESGRESLR